MSACEAARDAVAGQPLQNTTNKHSTKIALSRIDAATDRPAVAGGLRNSEESMLLILLFLDQAQFLVILCIVEVSTDNPRRIFHLVSSDIGQRWANDGFSAQFSGSPMDRFRLGTGAGETSWRSCAPAC